MKFQVGDLVQVTSVEYPTSTNQWVTGKVGTITTVGPYRIDRVPGWMFYDRHLKLIERDKKSKKGTSMALSLGDRVEIVRENSGRWPNTVGKKVYIEAIEYNGNYTLRGLPNGVQASNWSSNELKLISKKGKNTMAKYYQVKQTTPLWEEGAILKEDDGEYRAISDLWDKVDLNSEYLSAHIVEDKDNADFFQRVYEVSVLGKAKYLAKDAAKEAHAKLTKTKD